MRISLNLASHPYTDIGSTMQRLRTGMIVLLVLCLGLGIGLYLVDSKAAQARAREHSLDGQLAQIAKERQGYLALMQRPDNAQLLAQTAMINQLIDEKSFSWTLAMENLETVLPGGVQVTTLEPIRDKDGHITLHLRVVGPQDLSVDLVRNLEHSRRFVQPRIVGENAEESSNGVNQQLQPVSLTNRFDFDILADYNPPTPEERNAAKSTAKDSAEKNKSDSAPAATAPANRRQRLSAPSKPRTTVTPQGGAR